MINAIKSILAYVLSGLFASLLVAANYYHDGVEILFPALPPHSLLAFSIASCLGIVFLLWRKQREVEIQKGEVVAIVTHKFRTPLSGIKWAADMMSNEITLEKKLDVLKQLNNAADRLIGLVDLLVNFSKIDSRLEFAYAATSFRDLVEKSISKFAPEIKEKEIQISISCAENIPLIIIDREKIQFVVDVLIDNALKYTPKGGSIGVGVFVQGKYVHLAVEDTGVGMTWYDKLHLFKEFFRGSRARVADTEGMGLGLYAAKKIIDRHGGRLWGTSPGRNKGSTFFLKLKIAENYRS